VYRELNRKLRLKGALQEWKNKSQAEVNPEWSRNKNKEEVGPEWNKKTNRKEDNLKLHRIRILKTRKSHQWHQQI
jgi:hypothetical protein